MNTLLFILSIIWQLPQYALALLLYIVLKLRWRNDVTRLVSDLFDERNIAVFLVPNLFNSAVSLGSIIFVDRRIAYTAHSARTYKHELGHSKQSLILGPLYLLVIGLPSILGNLYSRIAHKDSTWYYAQPWEHWADVLGHVSRKSTA